jgi:UDP-arabinose 4-epimerase
MAAWAGPGYSQKSRVERRQASVSHSPTTRVLVTGGAGYVGSHVSKALLKAGFEPITLDDLSEGHKEAVKYGPLVIGSIVDTALVARLIDEWRVHAVLHFAASAYVRESLVAPEKYFRNNVGGSLALLEGCLSAKCVKAFVLSSTCAVYGIPEKTPIDETARVAPINPYGESKAFVERVLDWYGRIYGLRWAALRYFNAAGADQGGDLGELHVPETHIIPLAIEAARGGPPLTLLGLDHPTPDGTAVRDYVHVSDLADAHVQCLRYLLDGGEPRTFNLGAGSGTSVREIVRTVERVVGPVPVVEGARSPGDPPLLVADPSTTSRVLSWSAWRSDLEFIVRTAANWNSRRPREV